MCMPLNDDGMQFDFENNNDMPNNVGTPDNVGSPDTDSVPSSNCTVNVFYNTQIVRRTYI